jgi:hypothetical protein
MAVAQAIRRNAERFSVETFQARLLREVEMVTGRPASLPRSAVPAPFAA